MSKILEALKTSSMELKDKESNSETSPQTQKTSHELTQEQLADIYFSGSEKIKKSEYPTVIKVTEKPRPVSYVPWIITSAVIFIALFILISGKRVFVDVKVMDERVAAMRAVQDDFETSQDAVSEPSITAPETASNSKQKTVIHLGDKLPIQNFSFEGAAKLKSSKDRAALTLVNTSVAPFARAILRFDSPMNFVGSKVVFYAKGVRGGENIAFALKDKDNISAFNKNKVYPFANNLTTDWQRAEIPMFSLAKDFDAKAVASLRFEFGSKDTDNKPGDTIFIKDLQVVPL